jgi:hypothetical protein
MNDGVLMINSITIMKTNFFTILIFLLPVLVFSQTIVSYDKAKDIDFTKYETFQIYSLDVKSIPEFEPKKSGLSLMLTEIINQMESRGFVKVSENPDLIINLGVSIVSKNQTRESDIRDAPLYMGQRNYHWESKEVVVGTYTEGTVTLDLVDTQNEKMIWQVVGASVLSEKREKNRKRIIKAVKKMCKKFPVKPQTK